MSEQYATSASEAWRQRRDCPDGQFPYTRPVWAEISRSRLLHNYRALRALAAESATLIPVVKANAYGHGAALCAQWLAVEGVEWLGVTSVEEGIAVRAVCPQQRILVMSGIWHGEADAVIEHRLTPVIWEPFHIEALAEAAHRAGLTQQSLPVHLEIDTGMSRQGIAYSGLAEFLLLLQSAPALRLEAVTTHFYAPEELDSPATCGQIGRFATALDTITAAGFRPEILHAGNSTSLITGHGLETLRDIAERFSARLMLRPGLALYGYAPKFEGYAPGFEGYRSDFEGYGLQPVHSILQREGALAPEVIPAFQPVLSFKTRIVSLRDLAPGDTAGYNATFRAERPTRLALLPLGYADGYSRLLSNRGHVLIRGRRAPIAGRISMDQTIVDVTEIPAAAIGDEAMLIGEQASASGIERITAADLATLCRTIPWEILTSIAARVPRIPVD